MLTSNCRWPMTLMKPHRSGTTALRTEGLAANSRRQTENKATQQRGDTVNHVRASVLPHYDKPKLGEIMHCVANYEIKSDCSVVTNDLVLKVNHPKNLYRAHIKNIERTAFSTPFLLSLHLYFDTPTLNEAQDIADDLLSDCMNMLAFTTGASFKRHRIRQIVDATPGITGMRSLMMWSDSIEYEDPQPLLNTDTEKAIERLLEFDIPPAIRRAMRWYRLGINSTVPDDQFMNFWFALEIVAEYKKSTEKVSDKCPKCRSPLYCETCKTHPVHRPYAKQAIRDLLKAVDKNCDDTTIARLDKTRNSLMHGSTLKEIEDSLPQPHEEIVSVLGHLLWKALIMQYPPQMFDGTFPMGYPSTYIHQKIDAIAHIQTVVPVKADGELDLSFQGMTMAMTPHGPPQSAMPTIIRMSSEQYERLGKIRYAKGDHQEMCRRIFERTKKENDEVLALVLSTDMAFITDALQKGGAGLWQDLFREILGDGKTANG